MTIGQTSILVKDLSVSYGPKRVLTNIYLNIVSGSVYGVVGPNGAGKSTLFKSILGLIDMNNGIIEVLGGEIENVRKRVAYVPQKDDVDWNFPATVLDIVSIGRHPHRKIFQRLTKQDKKAINKAMEDLNILSLKNRQIGELSGGQQQRVFLARALCQEADIILLDEPFVGVDIVTEEKIIEILKSQAALGKTLLVVHHDLSSVEKYFDKIIMLNQRLIAYGDTSLTFNQENIDITYGGQLSILHKTGMLKGK